MGKVLNNNNADTKMRDFVYTFQAHSFFFDDNIQSELYSSPKIKLRAIIQILSVKLVVNFDCKIFQFLLEF